MRQGRRILYPFTFQDKGGWENGRETSSLSRNLSNSSLKIRHLTSTDVVEDKLKTGCDGMGPFAQYDAITQ